VKRELNVAFPLPLLANVPANLEIGHESLKVCSNDGLYTVRRRLLTVRAFFSSDLAPAIII
jgi:hypothetical protein